MMEKLQPYLTNIWNNVIDYAPKILLALITLWIGLKIVGWIARILERQFKSSGVDESLRPFLINLISWILKIMIFISVASIIGIQTTSFVAILGAAGLAVGLALQGTLANFAGGVLIMIFKPFKVGDLIEAQGQLGEVREIQIFTTILASLENKKVIIPNGVLSNDNIVNYTELGKIRVDLSVGIAYSEDIDKAKDLLVNVMQQNDKVLDSPAPFVGVEALADSSVNLAVRPYCLPKDYWDVYFSVLEACKKTLDEHQVNIPFPQLDVHMKPND